jgi:hypothetical protein
MNFFVLKNFQKLRRRPDLCLRFVRRLAKLLSLRYHAWFARFNPSRMKTGRKGVDDMSGVPKLRGIRTSAVLIALSFPILTLYTAKAQPMAA